MPTVDELRGQGRWAEALAQVGDPLERADLLNEQALFQGYAVRHLGFVFDADGHPDRAWNAFEESVRLRREEGFLPGVAAGLLTLGETAIEQGAPERARPLLEEARELAQLTGAEPFLRRIDEALESLP